MGVLANKTLPCVRLQALPKTKTLSLMEQGLPLAIEGSLDVRSLENVWAGWT
jgi:hypothetical protein